MSLPHEHTTKVYLQPKAKYRDNAILFPANITGGKDITKFGQKIEIKQTVDALVEQELSAIMDKNCPLFHAVKQYRAINKETADKLYITPLQDNITGVKATATLVFDGATLTAAVSKAPITSCTLKTYSFDFAVGTAVADIATAVKDAILANTSEWFTASAIGNTVTLTATNAGEFMNGKVFDVSKFNLPGIDVIFSGFTGGANDADTSTALIQYEQDNVNIITMESAAESAIEHAMAKYNQPYTDAKKTGLVFTPTDLTLFEIENQDRIGNGVYVPFYNKADTSKLPAGTDGVYGATVQASGLLAVVIALAYGMKKNQDGASTGRPTTQDYGALGGPNQYYRTFNETPLPSLPLSPFAKMTAPTMAERKLILDKKGYAYFYIDNLEQGALLSPLFVADTTFNNNPRRTVSQYDAAEFLTKRFSAVLQTFSHVQQAKVTETEVKIAFKTEADTIREQYPTFWITDEIFDQQKALFDVIQAKVVNGTLICDYSLVIDGHIEAIQSTATLYSQANLS